MAEKIYCLCGQLYDANRFMIQCDMCKEWFHGSCVGVQEYQSVDLDKYHCPRCEPAYGPSLFKMRTNWHRHNITEPDADKKAVQTGTAVFIKELKSRHFSSADDVVKKLPGKLLTVRYLQEHGFENPILIEDKEGLDMVVPTEDFSVLDVERYIGPDREVDVIDVTRQTDIRMKLCDFVQYFYSGNRDKILNVISLEFSNTKLAPLVEAPLIARTLDWVNYVWPKSLPEDAEFQKPEVQKYCLMGVQDSYTDFHVDFGGSSVWYHILKVDACHKCVMKQGETMLIPTGWIHAVLTPVDSLVFGGNFLHTLNITMQLQVYEIEKKIRTPGKFRFPAFEATNWYAAKALLQEMRTLNNQGTTLPNFLLVGVKSLIFTLKQWNQDKDYNKSRREEIPDDVESQKLLKELSKEVRHAERYLNSLYPPKPERESKRKKKKPVNKDFVDYSEPQNSLDGELMSPLKLTIRAVPKNSRKLNPVSASPVVRPPLKLTLPKPAMYPYSTNSFSNDLHSEPSHLTLDINHESAVLTENIDKMSRKPWTTIGDTHPHVKYKSEGELKIKLAKKQYLYPKGEELEHKSTSGIGSKFSLKSTEKSSPSDSIYDFHEESDDDKNIVEKNEDDSNADDEDEEDQLLIAEKSRKKKNLIPPFRMKLLHPGGHFPNGKLPAVNEMDVAGEVDVVSDAPKNGIDELLKASGYTVEPAEHNLRLADIESVQASPSTKEAIAGMLSISQQSYVGSTNSSEDESVSPRLRRGRLHFSDDYGENIDKVHQDDDYIYPTLDASDDDDLIFKPRGRRKLDEAWSPKARVGPLIPKTDRPMREGTKKQSVEKGLEAAAAKRAGMPAPKRPYNRKKVRVPEVSLPTSSSQEFTPVKKIDPKARKPRKGMATPKQRLGRILKIHKLKF
ncbi:histone lysine demethylase PHF8 isoform X2 [Anabrus simplex]|uniref:histone lysine demethylase PHF8 isoform X2 n=1 Tax=Anabrus simplex TaxID=316456 RepID=UPI0034DD90C3